MANASIFVVQKEPREAVTETDFTVSSLRFENSECLQLELVEKGVLLRLCRIEDGHDGCVATEFAMVGRWRSCQPLLSEDERGQITYVPFAQVLD